MGKECASCGKEFKRLDPKYSFKQGKLCKQCFEDLGFSGFKDNMLIADKTLEEVKALSAKRMGNNEAVDSFMPRIKNLKAKKPINTSNNEAVESFVSKSENPKVKKPIYKRWWFIVIAIILVAGITATQGNSYDPGTGTGTGTPTSNEDKVDNKDVSIEDQLTTLFGDVFNKKVDNLKVRYDSNEKSYVVSYIPTETFWDDTALLRICINDYIAYCKEAYAINGVNLVDFEISTTLQDAKGNEAVEPVLSIMMSKVNFETYNWDNLEYKSIYESFVTDCELFWAYPSIINNADTTKIYYAP